MAQWKRRLCAFGRYDRVAVRSGLYACSGCSVMFLNDSMCDGWHTVAPDVAMADVVAPIRMRR